MKQIARILIEFIPQAQQRYDTAGDWFYLGDTLHLKISRTKRPHYQQLVAVHELIECLLCNAAGVTQEAVDAFDMGPGKDLDEPGDHPDAPYRHQHQIASAVERVVASAMGVNWSAYESAVQDSGVRDPAGTDGDGR